KRVAVDYGVSRAIDRVSSHALLANSPIALGFDVTESDGHRTSNQVFDRITRATRTSRKLGDDSYRLRLEASDSRIRRRPRADPDRPDSHRGECPGLVGLRSRPATLEPRGRRLGSPAG